MLLFALTVGLVACPAPEPSPLELVGVLDDDDPAERVAVLREARGRSFTVRPGDVIEGSNALEVEAGALVVRRVRARVSRIEPGRVLLEGRHGPEVAASATAWVERRGCQPLFDSGRATELAAQARIVPAFERGAPVGFRLFSIRPGSAWSAAGLQNGDVVVRINGLDLTSPEKALVVYSTLRCARRLDVELRRGAERLDLVFLPGDVEREALQLAHGQGAFTLTALARGALLERAGLRVGDVVISVGGAPLTVHFVRAGRRHRVLLSSSSVLSTRDLERRD